MAVFLGLVRDETFVHGLAVYATHEQNRDLERTEHEMCVGTTEAEYLQIAQTCVP